VRPGLSPLRLVDFKINSIIFIVIKSSDMKPKILILVAPGFIGKNLALLFVEQDVELICSYHHTPPFELKKATWVQCDLLEHQEIQNMMRLKPDIVIQAAATTSGAKDIIERPYIHVTDNSVMNALLLREIYHAKIKHFIFFSCSLVYANSRRKVKESDAISHYNIAPNYFGIGWTKIYIEKACQFYAGISDTKFTVIRHSNVYGPHDKFDLERSHFMGASITKILSADEHSEIAVWGEGTEKRDLLYIDDLVSFVDSVIKKQKKSYLLVNVGSETLVSVNDAIQKIISVARKKIHIKHDLSKPSLKSHICLNCEQAYRLFNWKPKINLRQGIKKTIEYWLQTNRNF
ncbi:MAG: NAD(P)-dependent oxidoreductase, partial [Pseudomonadota bacterium]